MSRAICVVFRADDPRLVTGRIPGSLLGLCERCERPVEVTPGTRASYPDADLVCIGCLTPQEIESMRPRRPTPVQVEEILAFFVSRN